MGTGTVNTKAVFSTSVELTSSGAGDTWYTRMGTSELSVEYIYTKQMDHSGPRVHVARLCLPYSPVWDPTRHLQNCMLPYTRL